MDIGQYKVSKLFSFSKLSTFSKCAKKAYYRYVQGLRENPVFFLEGRAKHAGQEFDNLEKLAGKSPTMRQVLERAADSLNEEQKELEEKADVDSFLVEHAGQLTSFWESGERDLVRPVEGTVEARFDMTMVVGGQEVEFLGYVDTLSWVGEDDEKMVVDYKTGKRPIYPGDAARSFQFEIYKWGSDCKTGKVICFVNGGRQRSTTKITPIPKTTSVHREKTLTWVADTIQAFWEAEKTGNWQKCAPECYWCQLEVCSFYPKCYPATRVKGLIEVPEIRLVGHAERAGAED